MMDETNTKTLHLNDDWDEDALLNIEKKTLPANRDEKKKKPISKKKIMCDDVTCKVRQKLEQSSGNVRATAEHLLHAPQLIIASRAHGPWPMFEHNFRCFLLRRSRRVCLLTLSPHPPCGSKVKLPMRSQTYRFRVTENQSMPNNEARLVPTAFEDRILACRKPFVYASAF